MEITEVMDEIVYFWKYQKPVTFSPTPTKNPESSWIWT